MTNNYLSVERSGRVIEHAIINDNTNDEVVFENVLDMDYDDIKNYDEIDAFVMCIMDATNEYFGESDDSTIVTLIGEDDVFIWSIVLGPGENDGEIRYSFVDWRKDGKTYRYEK